MPIEAVTGEGVSDPMHRHYIAALDALAQAMKMLCEADAVVRFYDAHAHRLTGYDGEPVAMPQEIDRWRGEAVVRDVERRTRKSSPEVED